MRDERITVEADSAVQAEGLLVGARGVPLHWRGWLPDSPAVAVLVVSHGLCDHGGRYETLARRVVQQRVATYAMDHRGHGWSHGARANIGRMSYAVSDLVSFLQLVARRHPNTPLFLAGHSMGCVVALESVVGRAPPLAGLALSAPTVDLSAAPAAMLRSAVMLSKVAPGLGLVTVFGRERGDAVSREIAQDPLIYRGKAPARTIGELVATVNRLPGRLDGIRTPLLLQHGSNDQLVPLSASELVYRAAGSADKELMVYDGFGHEILTSSAGRPAGEDLVKWILERA
jgi:alpha-beta hydrolase superfamily lysophospholipase